MATKDTTDQSLDQELGALLEVERFDPPDAFRQRALLSDPSVYGEADRDPERWWAKQAEELHWFEPWDTVLDDSDKPFYKWFTGGKINASYNCLDRHVENGHGERVAFHWRGEEGEEREVSYADLLRDVQRFANALKDHGIGAGDVVGIFLPMIPEVVVAMLACARIGAPHNVVFGGFSPESVKDRMEVSNAKALVTTDGARRKGKTAAVKATIDEILPEVPSIETVFVVQHTGDLDPKMEEGRDVWYHEALEAADAECPAEPLDAEHPLFILYSSGSTAKPKGILHTTGGYLTGVACTTKYVFDLRPEEDVFWCTADVGWVTGHSYIVYGPLLNGATSVMYEGAPDYPHKGIWWELCEHYGVTTFYTAPTAIRACMKWGVEHVEKADLSSLQLLGSVGEPINLKAWIWYHKVVGGERCPVVDTDGNELEEGQGLLVIQRPWPGMLRTLFGDDERFVETYFKQFGPDVYVVGDAARRDEDGYFWILGRTDDVINVSGHRMSTAEIESAIVAYDKVAEAAVVAKADEDSGQAVVAFVTLEGDLEGDDAMEQEIRDHVAKRIGKLARPKQMIWADDLPKTRSGKIMRRLLRDIAEGRELGDVTTLRDPDVMEQLEGKIKERGQDDE